MHCPRCGLQQTSGEARFCRARGFFLGDVKELLAPEARNTEVDNTRARRVETAFHQGLLLMLVSLLLAIVLTLLHDIHLIPQIYVKVMAAIFVVAGLVRMFPHTFGAKTQGQSCSHQLRQAETLRSKHLRTLMLCLPLTAYPL